MFEQFTEQYFLNQAKEMGDELGIDTRTGSIYMDAAAGHCIRAAFFFQNLKDTLNMLAIDTSYGDALDSWAGIYGMSRHPAKRSVWGATFLPEDDEELPEIGDGERFFDDITGYYFLTETIDGVMRFVAEQAGAETNRISPGTDLVPVDDIDGLGEAILGELIVVGADEESDDSLRTRLREKLAKGAENGTRQHYKTWCESIDGVGRARIIPLFAGENTVEAILYSADGTPCSADVVEAVQNYIDPITQGYEFEDEDHNVWVCGDGFGDGVANLGAHFLARAAESLPVTLSVTVSVTEGHTVVEARAKIYAVITDYFKEIALTSQEGEAALVRIATVGSKIIELEEILDYADLELNGQTGNILVPDGKVALLSEVVVNE